MIRPVCPLCGNMLQSEACALRCAQGHSFDIARQGYVNLLTVDRKHSLSPGDTREMVAARRAFLNAGYYAPIAQAVERAVRLHCPQANCVLDVGCGEGYYLKQLAWLPERWGIDISKDAVRYAAARDKNAHWLTATAAHLPFADNTFDCVLSMFALTVEGEFARVLKRDGVFMQVLAGERHLPALKGIIYPELHEKKKDPHPKLEGFVLRESETLRFSFSLQSAEMVHNLLYMTPHVWRISKEGAQRLAQTSALEDCAEVIMNIYGRQTD